MNKNKEQCSLSTKSILLTTGVVIGIVLAIPPVWDKYIFPIPNISDLILFGVTYELYIKVSIGIICLLFVLSYIFFAFYFVAKHEKSKIEKEYKGSVDKFKKDTIDMSQRISNLESKNAELIETNNIISEKTSSLDGENESLRQNNDSIKVKFDKSKKEISDLKEVNKKYAIENNNLKEKLNVNRQIDFNIPTESNHDSINPNDRWMLP